jgi:hypothetical protein
LEVDGHDLGFGQLEVLVGIGRLNRVPSWCAAKHAVTGHLNVDDVLVTIAEGVWKNPLCALTATGKALERISIFCPNHPFVVGIPVELKMLLITEFWGDAQHNPEPVGGPRRAKPLSDSCLFKRVRDCIFECRSRQIGGMPDGELHVRLSRCSSFVHHAENAVLAFATKPVAWRMR